MENVPDAEPLEDEALDDALIDSGKNGEDEGYVELVAPLPDMAYPQLRPREMLRRGLLQVRGVQMEPAAMLDVRPSTSGPLVGVPVALEVMVETDVAYLMMRAGSGWVDGTALDVAVPRDAHNTQLARQALQYRLNVARFAGAVAIEQGDTLAEVRGAILAVHDFEGAN